MSRKQQKTFKESWEVFRPSYSSQNKTQSVNKMSFTGVFENKSMINLKLLNSQRNFIAKSQRRLEKIQKKGERFSRQMNEFMSEDYIGKKKEQYRDMNKEIKVDKQDDYFEKFQKEDSQQSQHEKDMLQQKMLTQNTSQLKNIISNIRNEREKDVVKYRVDYKFDRVDLQMPLYKSQYQQDKSKYKQIQKMQTIKNATVEEYMDELKMYMDKITNLKSVQNQPANLSELQQNIMFDKFKYEIAVKYKNISEWKTKQLERNKEHIKKQQEYFITINQAQTIKKLLQMRKNVVSQFSLKTDSHGYMSMSNEMQKYYTGSKGVNLFFQRKKSDDNSMRLSTMSNQEHSEYLEECQAFINQIQQKIDQSRFNDQQKMKIILHLYMVNYTLIQNKCVDKELKEQLYEENLNIKNQYQ